MRFLLAIGCLLAGIDVPAAAAERVGVTTMAIELPDGDRVPSVTLWYPALAGGTAVRVGDGAVFEGVDGWQDAPVAEGPFPIVLVAHGGLRVAPGHGNWIASRLAGRGFVAAVVRGPTLGPRDAAIAVQEIWRRPADLSATLSALEGDPSWSGHLDRDKVGAVGFFLGGTSVLSLVGARLDPERFAESCDAGGTGVDCAWFAGAGVDLQRADPERLARSNLDPRVKVAIAIDPELATSFSTASLAGITAPVEIINLGRPEPGLTAAELATAIPGARYATLPDATPFSAFGVCKPKALAVLAEEGEPQAICQEDGDRGIIHARLALLMADGLARTFHRP